MGASEKVREALEPFGARIDLAFIFGSAARGEQTANSDIDLFIVEDIEIADLALPLRSRASQGCTNQYDSLCLGRVSRQAATRQSLPTNGFQWPENLTKNLRDILHLM